VGKKNVEKGREKKKKSTFCEIERENIIKGQNKDEVRQEGEGG
jgi:hypothetical protein